MADRKDTKRTRTLYSSKEISNITRMTPQPSNKRISKSRPVKKNSLSDLKDSFEPKRPPRGGRGKKTNIKQKRQKILFLGAIIFVLIVCGIYTATKKNGLEVFVGQTSIGIIKNKDATADDLLKTVTAQLKEARGSDVKINEQIILTPVHISGKNKKNVVTVDYVIPKIRETVTYKVAAAVIKVDGATAAVLSNEEQAAAVLNAILEEYKQEDKQVEAVFVEKVETVTEFVESEQIITPEVAAEKFQTGTKTQKVYTIQSGDRMSIIASNAGMTMAELLSANPGYTIETILIPGQTMNILVEKPFLSVKTVEEIKRTEVVPKEYEYREDNTKNKGYKKVVQQGKDGQREVTVQIIRMNGFEDEQKEVSSTIIEEPVKEIIVQGTR